jgi:hypothetical protein
LLSSITLPSDLTSIGDNVFSGCQSIATITLPAGVTSIGYNAFSYSSLTRITIPAGVTYIRHNAFAGCTDLTNIYFLGEPPILTESEDIFGSSTTPNIFYLAGTPGWGETFSGRSAQPFYPGIWYQATEHKDSWLSLGWFGWFADMNEGWIYHLEHGYQLVAGEDTGSFYFYDASISSWFWTSDADYPYLYRLGESSGWFWYYPNGHPGSRWFYRYADGADVAEVEM